MRIWCIGMVKNEADIIEAFIRHTARLVDHVVLLDNASTDGTREILAALVHEGLPLTVLDDPLVAFIQAEKTTFLLRRVLEQAAPDFVLPLDADEFLTAADREALEAALATVPDGAYGLIHWRSFVARPEDAGGGTGDPPRDLRFRVAPKREGGRYKAVIRCAGMLPHQVKVQQGNHRIRWNGAEGVRIPGLALAHYPVRGLEQLTQKLALGYIGYAERNRGRDPGTAGLFRREGGRRVLEGELLQPAELLASSLGYANLPADSDPATLLVEDPLPVAYTLRPIGTGRVSAVATLARALIATGPDGQDRFLAALAKRPGGGAARVDLPPLRHILDRSGARSVLDIGCGLGERLVELGCAGVEDRVGMAAAEVGGTLLEPGCVQRADPALPFDLGRRFDLVIGVEAAALVRPGAEDAMVGNILRHAGGIVLFGAEAPGAPHAGGWTGARWLAAFAAQGWHPALHDTLAVRLAASFPWFRRGLMVLRRGAPPDEAVPGFPLAQAQASPASDGTVPAVVTTALHGLG